MHTEIKVSAQRDATALMERAKEAQETFERARAKLELGELTAEDARYLNQLFTSMVATETTMSW